MNTLEFSVTISASKDTVWNVLWDDKSFRDWSNIIDEGTYMVGSLIEGKTVEFMSASGYGVTSKVNKLIPNEFIEFIHMSDTQNSGKNLREAEWTGNTESYTLTAKEGKTILTIKSEIPDNQLETFNSRIPLALERIKLLAERV